MKGYIDFYKALEEVSKTGNPFHDKNGLFTSKEKNKTGIGRMSSMLDSHLDSGVDSINGTIGFFNKETANRRLDTFIRDNKNGVDFSNLKSVSSQKLTQAGWGDCGSGMVKIHTVGYTSADGKRGATFTPIKQDGSVLSPEELSEYASGVLEGAHDDYLRLMCGGLYTEEDAEGEESIEEMISEMGKLIAHSVEISGMSSNVIGNILKQSKKFSNMESNEKRDVLNGLVKNGSITKQTANAIIFASKQVK